MKELILLKFIPLIMAIPAITIGVIAMKFNDVSTTIWAQNIVCLVFTGLISYIILSGNISMARSKYNNIFILLPVVLLALTFNRSGMMGVHRWISIGPVKLNVSMVFMPATIILLWELLKVKAWWFAMSMTVIISLLLFIQPDASQLTGFAIPMMIMLCSKTNKKVPRSIIVGALSILVIISWIYLDGLPPVAYVEGIVSLVASMGQIWLVLGIISLALLPMPFILFPPRKLKLPSVCIGLYFIIIILSTLFGNFPVPLMGYGISPIIGYIIPITWYAKAKINQ
jgi:hypothetical protein